MSRLHRSDNFHSFNSQRGKGIGNVLGSFYRAAAPLIKKVVESPIAKEVLLSAGNAAKEAGLNIVADRLNGKGGTVRENVVTAKRKIAATLKKSLQEKKVGGGKKRKKSEEVVSGRGKRKKVNDLFDETFED